MVLSMLSTLFGGKVQTIIIGVLILAVFSFGATTYFMVKKNGAQSQIIKTMEGDIKSLKAANAIDKAAKEKSDQDLKQFQTDQAALASAQVGETRRLQNTIFNLKQRIAVGVQNLEPLRSDVPIDTRTIADPEKNTEALTDEQKKQIECLDRLVPGPILDELFGLRNRNPDQN